MAFYDNSGNHFRDFDVARIEEFGQAIAAIIAEHEAAGEEVLLLATTDLVHHETKELAAEQDPAMLDMVAALDVQGLYDYVTAGEVSICGEIPTAIMMVALRELGHDSAEIISLGNSLHANPDEADVIGYPAMAAWK
jgi:MEMO1 family protein